MSKSNSKKHIGIIMGLMVLFGIIIFGLQLSSVYGYSFTTDSYNVEMTVHENNTIDITETISVDFNTYKHGLYRYIPLKGNIHFKKDGEEQTVKTTMKIKDISVEGYQFDTYKENDNMVIQIGDPDRTVIGEKTYEISYKCVLYDDGTTVFDMFYFNVLPMDWETPIENARVGIIMPKAFDEQALESYAGKYGTNVEGYTKTSTNGKKIQVETVRELPQGIGASVQVFLPEGYFSGEATTSWALPLLMGLSLLAVAAALILWFLFGRDPRMIKTVEFYPPEGLSSGEIGYILDGSVDKQDMVSMIIYFADKGYLSIEEKGKKDFILHKEKELPQDAKGFEKTFFNGLFEGGADFVSVKDLGESFYSSYEASEDLLKGYYEENKEKNIFAKSGNIARVAGYLLSIIPLGISIWLGAYFYREIEFALAIPFICLPLLLDLIWISVIYDRKESMKKGKGKILQIISLALGIILVIVGGILIEYLTNIVAAALAVLCTAVIGICTVQMRKRTPYGAEMQGKILGFKNFIRVSEIDKLKLLAEENPKYFYNILPYAYVFGLSDTWAKKFEDIAVEPPTWYRGSYGNTLFNTWLFINVFDNCTGAFRNNIYIPPTDSRGSVGGSFGGGGGFSGGGFGGGGGSW